MGRVSRRKKGLRRLKLTKDIQNLQKTAAELKSIPLFSHLPARHLRLIMSHCKVISMPKGTIILEQHEQSCDLYVILSGKVKVSLLHHDGREIMLNTLTDSDFFGEMSFFDRKSRSAMISALTTVKMLFLPHDAFMKILSENSDISIQLLYGMASRLRRANEAIETLTFLDVAGRVAKVFIDLAEHGGEVMPDGNVKIICPTHMTIANQIGASREAVTKAIKSLASNRLIIAKGREVFISPRQFAIL